MARYMTDIERKELKKFEDKLLESLKELREKIPNYKSEEDLAVGSMKRLKGWDIKK